MARIKRILPVAAVACQLLACASALGERGPAVAMRPIPPPAPAPYRLDLLDEDGSVLPSYQHNGRFYTLGTAHERYKIRVTNPTGTRIEAVVSVDGLDAIDGTTATYTTKRGYVIPAYGELRLDGFRVSQNDVATFRFGSVGESYAGRKGQARNVGVIGVAIFAEREAPPPTYLPEEETHWRDGYDEQSRGPGAAPPPAADKSAPKKEASASGESRRAPAPATATASNGDAARPMDPDCCDRPAQHERAGLGTEFGERRSAPVQWTTFQRANASRPTAMAEIRYNDRDGLTALGILMPTPSPGPDELELRETATPFPYAAPPPGWTR